VQNNNWYAGLDYVLGFGLILALSLTAAYAQKVNQTATVQRIALVGDENGIAVAITSSGPVTPLTQVLDGPDRVVIDFPHAVPGGQLHGFTARKGELKGVRVGLFSNNPPTTRVVLDLASASSFQVIPSGNTLVVTLGDSGITKAAQITPEPQAVPRSAASVTITRRPVSRPVASAAAVSKNAVKTSSGPADAIPTDKHLQVDFSNGLLTIDADQATLSEVLYEVQRRTGADMAIPAGAERDKVAIKAGPGSPKEVIATLLNGSHFNFILIGSTQDKDGVRSVILTPKTGEPAPQAHEQKEEEADGPDQQPLSEGVGDGAPAAAQTASQPPH